MLVLVAELHVVDHAVAVAVEPQPSVAVWSVQLYASIRHAWSAA